MFSNIRFPLTFFVATKEMVPHRGGGERAHSVAQHTCLSLAHSCNCKGTAQTSLTLSFQHILTKMITFWEEIYINKVVSMFAQGEVACKGRSRSYLKQSA